MSGNVKRIVVTYQDRLARFGFDLLQWFCAKHSCEILVLHKVELSPQREMVEDILSIFHSFSARLYGLRKYSSQISKFTQKKVSIFFGNSGWQQVDIALIKP